MKYFYFFIFAISILTTAKAQEAKLDSLKAAVQKATNENQKLNALDSLCLFLINQNSSKESIPYFEEFIEIAIKLKREKLESSGYRYLSESYMRLGDSIPSINNAKKSLVLGVNKREAREHLLSSNQLGRVYDRFKQYDKAIETYTNSINQFHDSKLDSVNSTLITIYNNLGIAYGRVGNTKKEIETYLKAAEFAEMINDYKGKNTTLYGIGWLYMGLEQYEKADIYFKKSLKDSAYNPNQVLTDRVFHGIGINSSRKGNLKEAIYYNKEALRRFRRRDDKLYEFDVLNNMAVVYDRMNKPDSTEYYAKKALSVAEIINHKLAITGAKQTLSGSYLKQKKYSKAEKLLLEIAKDTIDEKIISFNSKVDLYNKLTNLYEGKGNIEKSFIYLKAFKNGNDSILVKQRDDNIAEVETKYQTAKKEKELLQVKTEKAEQASLLAIESKRKWQLGSGLLAALIGLGIFAYFYHQNKKQKNLVETLQKELHHRLKNNLSFIDLFINLAKSKFKDKAYKSKLDELQNRINSMFEVHQQLFKKDDVTSVSASNYIDVLVNNVEKSYDKSNITIIKDIHKDETLLADSSFPIGLIVNEFLTNSYKYAFSEKDNGTIQVSLKEKGKVYHLELKDNGKGLPKEFDIDKLDSFGMETMQLLTREYNGTFDLDGTKGVTMTITLPKTAA